MALFDIFSVRNSRTKYDNDHIAVTHRQSVISNITAGERLERAVADLIDARNNSRIVKTNAPTTKVPKAGAL